MTEKTSDNNFTNQNYFLGRQYNKDKFKKSVDNIVSANTSSIVSSYAKALKAVTVSDLESSEIQLPHFNTSTHQKALVVLMLGLQLFLHLVF
ncbi:hypothetical protein GCM10008013_10740 [Paenibacillus segetis]|uniref:Uncharacterized protein n=1 Tax=Paenibacillus segetis TaxID=1325360 RepID=A0ABQ1Y9N7_9BACL|nr:hypothetical protein GCM10008013_10740 [Paenibacillus segetis]